MILSAKRPKLTQEYLDARRIPPDIWVIVSQFLSLKDLLSLRLVAKKFSKLRAEELKIKRIKRYLGNGGWSVELPIEKGDWEIYDMIKDLSQKSVLYHLSNAIYAGRSNCLKFFWAKMEHPSDELLIILSRRDTLEHHCRISNQKMLDMDLYDLLTAAGYKLNSNILFYLEIPSDIKRKEVEKLSCEEKKRILDLCLDYGKNIELVDILLSDHIPFDSDILNKHIQYEIRALLRKHGHINYPDLKLTWILEDGKDESEVLSLSSTDSSVDSFPEEFEDIGDYFFEIYPHLKSDERYKQYMKFFEGKRPQESWMGIYKYFYPEINGNDILLNKLIEYEERLKDNDRYHSELDVVLFFSDLMSEDPNVFSKHRKLFEFEKVDSCSIYISLYDVDCLFLFKVFLDRGGKEIVRKQLFGDSYNDQYLWELLLKTEFRFPPTFEELKVLIQKIEMDDSEYRAQDSIMFYLVQYFSSLPNFLEMLVELDTDFIYIYIAILSRAKPSSSLTKEAQDIRQELSHEELPDYDGSVISYLKIRCSFLYLNKDETNPLLFLFFTRWRYLNACN